jgi:hypothetical protein
VRSQGCAAAIAEKKQCSRFTIPATNRVHKPVDDVAVDSVNDALQL